METNVPDAVVWVDSVALGLSSEGNISVIPGLRRVTLVPPDADTWLLPRPQKTVLLEEGDTVVVQLRFPYVYQIHSSPFDASVWLGESGTGVLLGATPLVLSLPEPMRDSVAVIREGYHPARALPGDRILNRIFLNLEPNQGPGSVEGVNLIPGPGRSRGRWIPVAATGWAIASAGVAIHYKSRADRLYDEYRITGDPLLRPEIRRNDTRSAFALGSLQFAVGVLAFKLVVN